MSVAEGLFKQIGRIDGFGRVLGWSTSRARALDAEARRTQPLAAFRVTGRGASRQGNASQPLDLWLVPPRTLSWNDRVSLAEQAMERASRAAAYDLGRGLTGLACVASSALGIGVLGTVFGLAAPSLGCGANSMAAIGAWFADALFSAPPGLLVAVGAYVAHRSLDHQRYNLAVALPFASAVILDWIPARATGSPRLPGSSTWRLPGVRFPISHLENPTSDHLDPSIRQCTSSTFYKLLLLWIVMAVLLSLMLTSRLDVTAPMPVNLPETSQPVVLDRSPTELIVSIKADGQRFVDSNWIPRERFAEALLNAREDSHRGRLLLNADRYLPYRDVLEVLRSARDAGFTNVTFITLEAPHS